MRGHFIAAAWVIWVVNIAVLTMIIRNPFYLVILLLVARIVYASCRRQENKFTFPFWRLAATILLFSMSFNMLLVHFGQTILFVLPGNWWLIGGPVTLEAAVFGAINGLTLITLLAVFMAFNAIVPVSELIRLTPRSLSNVGLVILIAMTYVPETRNQLQRIREAQELRGHQIHGLRDWRPIVIPLLIGGMERAINISETMVSRGYGATSSKRQPLRTQFGLLGGLLLIFAGAILIFWFSLAGWMIVATGILIILGIFIWSGRQIQITRYRPQSWTKRDWLLSILSFVPLILIWVPLGFVDSSTIYFTPYPLLTLPEFDLVLGIGLAILALPAILTELWV